MTAIAVATHTLAVPGAKLAYDLRPGSTSDLPPLFLVGSPMAAAGFGTLEGHFPDRTVVTYDPRGSERSTRTDPSSPSTPPEHADDLHRLIREVGLGPVDLFASSGGAVNALALVAKHPEDVRSLVAHEPPLASLLPDAENAKAAIHAVRDTYQSRGFGAGMAHFIALTSHDGPFGDDFAGRPAPDPAMFGMPADDDGSRTDVLLAQNLVTCTHYEPELDALRSASTRIVVAVGAESEGQMARRAAEALAGRLHVEPVIFPSHHGGFLAGEYGWAGEPDAFASRLCEVLEGA